MHRRFKKIASLRKSQEVLVYMTADTTPPEYFSAGIAPDIIDFFYKHLSELGKKEKISLILHSNGGSLDAPWPLISLIREYCDIFEVIIPSKALSAATLICLGADKIVMTPLSTLSPIDPLGTFTIGQEKKSIQVEDVYGFIDFVKKRVGISEQMALSEMTKTLTAEIPPSKLGSINRTHSLIRMLAEKILKTHKESQEEDQIKSIIENLTEKLFSHQHLIGRNEAKNKIGFKEIIDYATDTEEVEIRSIFDYYKAQLKLGESVDFSEILGGDEEKKFELTRAHIESSAGTTSFKATYEVKKSPPDSSPPFVLKMEKQGWESSF